MGRKRDLFSEISDIRARLLFGSAYSELVFRRFALEQAFKQRDEANVEFLRYVPVALVACYEGFFRLAVKEFIDTGSPYLERAAKLSGGMKFDFEMLTILHNKKFTIGEVIAHNLSWSNLANINANMSPLMDSDFLTELRSVYNRVDHEVHGSPKTPILSEPDVTYKYVERLFELRHVICHEIASGFEFSPDELEACYSHGVRFLDAAIELINCTLQPDAPLTQADINASAISRREAAQQSLLDLIQEYQSMLDESRVTAFLAVNEAWENYVELASQFDADRAKGGSIWPTLYSGAAERLTRERIHYLQDLLLSEDQS